MNSRLTSSWVAWAMVRAGARRFPSRRLHSRGRAHPFHLIPVPWSHVKYLFTSPAVGGNFTNLQRVLAQLSRRP